jgi:hypothetical protein
MHYLLGLVVGTILVAATEVADCDVKHVRTEC